MFFLLCSSLREPEYYDYGHGETQEAYEPYGKTSTLHSQAKPLVLVLTLYDVGYPYSGLIIASVTGKLHD